MKHSIANLYKNILNNNSQSEYLLYAFIGMMLFCDISLLSNLCLGRWQKVTGRVRGGALHHCSAQLNRNYTTHTIHTAYQHYTLDKSQQSVFEHHASCDSTSVWTLRLCAVSVIIVFIIMYLTAATVSVICFLRTPENFNPFKPVES